MRVAVFADVHGNLSALEAVLADIDRQGPFDLIVFAGDLCLYGPRPEACVQLIRSRSEIACLYGETDQWIDGPPLLSKNIEREERERRQKIHDLVDWTRERPPEQDRAWLRELPFQRRFSPTVQPRDDLLMVHANPKDVRRVILPPVEQQKEFYGTVRQCDTDLDPLLADLVAEVLVFGHLHVPFVRDWRRFKLVNAGPVGMPADGDGRARHVVFDWDQQQEDWQITHRAVEYDIAPEVEAFRRTRPPGWQEAVESLKAQGFLNQPLVHLKTGVGQQLVV